MDTVNWAKSTTLEVSENAETVFGLENLVGILSKVVVKVVVGFGCRSI